MLEGNLDYGGGEGTHRVPMLPRVMREGLSGKVRCKQSVDGREEVSHADFREEHSRQKEQRQKAKDERQDVAEQA